MILQYFKKKENEYKLLADKVYLKILDYTKLLLKKKYFYHINFNTSFELISIFLVFYLKFLYKNNYKFKKRFNDELMKNFINDLDQSLRDSGIADMSIGKYVKKHVKKFYFRLKIFDNIFENSNYVELVDYLNSLKLIDKNSSGDLVAELTNIFSQIKKNKDINYL